MAIIVAYKYAANPQDASVGADGRLDISRAKEALSEYDPVAIQAGRELADATGTELVGISVGGSAVASGNAKKSVMARGLDRGLLVADDATRDWNATTVGGALAELVRRVDGADLVLTGDASIDEGAQLVPAVVAGHLGWPCFLEVSAVERAGDGWRLTQAHEGGTRTVAVTGPVVVSMTTDANEPRTPGMKDMLAAGKKPSETVAVADLTLPEIALDVTAQGPAPAPERRHQMFDGADAPAELAQSLHAAGVL